MMTTTPLYPPGVPCWVEVTSPDAATVAPFYRDLFGWQIGEGLTTPDGGTYLVASGDGGQVAGLVQPGGPAGGEAGGRDTTRTGGGPGIASGAWRTYVGVADLEAAASAVVDAGGSVNTPAFDVPGLARAALFTDPSGAVFGARELTEHRGAEVVNAPNSWNFNTLRTSDPEAMARFYGAVFGWRATAVDFGFATATMWCLPGYGDFLDARNPGWKQGHIDGGSPAGFTDAVGWLEQDADGPNWTVEFNVPDAARTAERAADLGGQVLVGPVDLGGTGSAVLADPTGAQFTVNDYGSIEE